jgi:septal ring factor EnvC (AmiA/AmiB activator)
MAESQKPETTPHISAPQDFPVTTPRIAQPGHDFTLQAVFETQRSVADMTRAHAETQRAIGEITTKLDRLISDGKSSAEKIEKLSEKIDKVKSQITFLAGAAAACGFLITLGLAALRFLPPGVVPGVR